MFRFLTTITLAILLLTFEGTLSMADEFDSVREQITKGLEEQKVAALSVAVAKDGKFVWQQGFGQANLEKKTPATEHTMFSLASISKPITATALMMLVEQGKINLDKPINDYLDDDAKVEAFLGNPRNATVRRVAEHGSGLPLHYQFFYEHEPYRRPPMSVTIRRYAKLVQPPGESFLYSNLGYGILDHIIAKQAGKPFAKVLRDDLFEPLGMTHAAIDVPDDLKEFAAERYTKDLDPIPFYDFDHPGASAVFCSAHDLATFGMFHLGQLPPAKQKLLDPETLAQMHRPTQPVPERDHDCYYSIGWLICKDEHGHEIHYHTGGMGGVRTILGIVPSEGLVVVVLTNSEQNLYREVCTSIFDELLPGYRETRLENEKQKVEESPEDNSWIAREKFVGNWAGAIHTYEGKRKARLVIGSDGAMTLKIDDGPAHPVDKAKLEHGYFTGVTLGDLRTEDDNRQEYDLNLRLRMRGDRLTGSIVSKNLPRPIVGNGLSHWIDLARE